MLSDIPSCLPSQTRAAVTERVAIEDRQLTPAAVAAEAGGRRVIGWFRWVVTAGRLPMLGRPDWSVRR